MNRRELFKNALIGIAITILPEILRPVPAMPVDEIEAGFIGIIPMIKKHANVIQYEPNARFDINEIFQ